jgi:hypothetical protein
MSILVCPLITKGLRSIRGYTSTASYLQPWQQDISFSKPLSIRKEGILYFFFFFCGREMRFLRDMTVECEKLLLFFFFFLGEFE